MAFNKKKLYIGASLFALFNAPLVLNADEASAPEWQPRSVEDVTKDLVKNEGNQITYTVKAGDVLNNIAKAFKINDEKFKQFDELYNYDLIQPEMKLIGEYDEDDAEQVVHTLTIVDVDGSERKFDFSGETPVEVFEAAPVQTVAAVNLYQPTRVSQVSQPATLPRTVSQWVDVTRTTFDNQEDVEENAEDVEETVAQAPIARACVVNTPVQTVTTVTPAEETAVEEVEETPTPAVPTPAVADEVVADHEEAVAPVSEPVVEEENVAPVVEETATFVEPAVEVEEVEAPVETPAPAPASDYNPMNNPKNAGLVPAAAKYRDEVESTFGITNIGTVRPGDPGDHGTGKAIDIMVPVDSALGDEVAQHAINNMAANDIHYVIWKQRIYGDWTNGQWQHMEDRNSITQNHRDHVHVSFN